MPFEREYATGESLLSLEQSEAFREFKARVRIPPPGPPVKPTELNVARNDWTPRRVIAVDGSTVSTPVRNGFPMAEATILKVAIVSIDLSQLGIAQKDDIPSPRTFYDMEKTSTLDCVLPGANIEQRDVEGDTPRQFFRETVFEAFNGRIGGHETLIETVRAIIGGPHTPARPPACPIEDCDQRLASGTGAYVCGCPRQEKLFETDAFRFAERFSEVSSNGEAHGEVRHVLEVVALLNVLRFFARTTQGLAYLRDNVFVLDGPLALFGHPAWLTPYVRDELCRINDLCRAKGFDLALFGFEKSGNFVEHFDQIDTTPERGPRSRYPAKTVFGLDAAYINRNIALRPEGAKSHGDATYFGRKLFYKTAAGDHAVVTTAMTTRAGREFERCDLACYPRLGDMLNVLDQLATYLHRDGFMPLVRAHAHAAIPLRRGTDLIRSLFGEGNPR